MSQPRPITGSSGFTSHRQTQHNHDHQPQQQQQQQQHRQQQQQQQQQDQEDSGLKNLVSPKSLTQVHVRKSAAVRKSAKSLTNLTLTWTERPRNVLLVKKHRDPEVSQLTQELLQWLIVDMGFVVYLEQSALEEDHPPIPTNCQNCDPEEIYANLRVWRQEDDEDSQAHHLDTVDEYATATATADSEISPNVAMAAPPQQESRTPFLFSQLNSFFKKKKRSDLDLSILLIIQWLPGRSNIHSAGCCGKE